MCSALALAITGIWLGGCTGRGLWSPDAISYRTRYDDPIVLDLTQPVAIDVESFGGDVIIVADAALPSAAVRITREARHGFLRIEEAIESMFEIDYSVEVAAGELGPVLKVRTWTTHDEPYFQRAHVRIHLPTADGVTVRTRDGKVYATNVQGAVDIMTSRGDVRLMTNLPMRRSITIVNEDGSIDYRVRGVSRGAFDCQSVGGEVAHRVRQGQFIVHTGSDHDTLRATLNGGVNPIILRATNGDIRIAVVANPTDVGTWIADP